MNVNMVVIAGNLTRDPELKALPSGQQVAQFALAVNERYKTKDGQKRETVHFFDIVAFGRQAEVAGEYLAKGRAVLVEGRLQQDRWDDKETGAKRSRIKIMANRIHFLGGKTGQTNGGASITSDEDIPF